VILTTKCRLGAFPHFSLRSEFGATMSTVSRLLKRLEVEPKDDEYEAIETSRWGNRDVYPIAHDKRTYGIYAYVSYWGE
jgi:cytosine/uracil/thiamine/allantoin permease